MLRRFSKFPLWRIQTFVKIQPQNQRFFANVSKQNDDDDDDIDHDEGPLNPDRNKTTRGAMLKYLKKSFAADEEEPKTSIWSKLKSANPKTAPSSEGRAFNARHAGSKNRKKQDSSEQNEKKGSKFDRRDDKAATKGSDDSRNPNVFAYSWEVGYEDKLVDAMEKSAEFEARQSEAMKQQAARLEDDDDDDFGTPFPEEEEEEEDEDEIRRRRRFVSYTIDDDIAEFEEAAMGEESDDSDDSEDDDTIVVNKTDHDDDDTEEEMEEGRDDDDVDGKRKPSKKKKDDEDEDGELDEIEDALLNGEEKIDFRNGELVWDDEDDELDDMDELLAEVWVQSSKSADGTFTMVHHSDRAKHVQLPKPRTLLEMLEAIEPQIPPEVTHPLAKEFFLNSWEVVQKNIYMTDGQKRYVSQQIALKTQKIMSLYNEYEEYDRTRVLPIPTYLDPQEFSPYSDYDDPLDKEEPDDSEGAKRRANKRNSDKSKVPAVVKETPQQREARKKNEKLKLFKFMDDIIFHEDFKAGTTFYEKELKWKHEEELARQGPAKAVSTEETDWTMEAVDDEDALQRQLDQDNLTKRK